MSETIQSATKTWGMGTKELETLERAGVIVRSILPWASPIVIVLKGQNQESLLGGDSV